MENLRQITNHGPLESANKTLYQSSYFLHKLQCLEILVEELANEVAAGEFDCNRVIAEMLVDVKQQLTALEFFRANPYVIHLEIKVFAIEDELQRKVQWIFREIGPLMAGADETGRIFEKIILIVLFQTQGTCTNISTMLACNL